eukprot:TRINITY_DN1972_c0_g1_i1.p1 TRINITY_DN1972_c0_g1~~TRINITY_DN1972_c0_g1_i1.p1  ORF type:complete len:792 (+),score=194.88 TRINITY_DN1972_c0_g1_i1:1412-3787(+)
MIKESLFDFCLEHLEKLSAHLDLIVQLVDQQENASVFKARVSIYTTLIDAIIKSRTSDINHPLVKLVINQVDSIIELFRSMESNGESLEEIWIGHHVISERFQKFSAIHEVLFDKWMTIYTPGVTPTKFLIRCLFPLLPRKPDSSKPELHSQVAKIVSDMGNTEEPNVENFDDCDLPLLFAYYLDNKVADKSVIEDRISKLIELDPYVIFAPLVLRWIFKNNPTLFFPFITPSSPNSFDNLRERGSPFASFCRHSLPAPPINILKQFGFKSLNQSRRIDLCQVILKCLPLVQGGKRFTGNGYHLVIAQMMSCNPDADIVDKLSKLKNFGGVAMSYIHSNPGEDLEDLVNKMQPDVVKPFAAAIYRSTRYVPHTVVQSIWKKYLLNKELLPSRGVSSMKHLIRMIINMHKAFPSAVWVDEILYPIFTQPNLHKDICEAVVSTSIRLLQTEWKNEKLWAILDGATSHDHIPVIVGLFSAQKNILNKEVVGRLNTTWRKVLNHKDPEARKYAWNHIEITTQFGLNAIFSPPSANCGDDLSKWTSIDQNNKSRIIEAVANGLKDEQASSPADALLKWLDVVISNISVQRQIDDVIYSARRNKHDQPVKSCIHEIINLLIDNQESVQMLKPSIPTLSKKLMEVSSGFLSKVITLELLAHIDWASEPIKIIDGLSAWLDTGILSVLSQKLGVPKSIFYSDVMALLSNELSDYMRIDECTIEDFGESKCIQVIQALLVKLESRDIFFAFFICKLISIAGGLSGWDESTRQILRDVRCQSHQNPILENLLGQLASSITP